MAMLIGANHFNMPFLMLRCNINITLHSSLVVIAEWITMQVYQLATAIGAHYLMNRTLSIPIIS